MQPRLHTLLALSLAACAVAGICVPAASAAKPARVSGTLGGAKLPKASQGVAAVHAVALDSMAIRGSDRVSAGGRYALSVPAGKYALVSSIVQRGVAAKTVLSGVIRVRAGQKRKLKLSAKKVRHRKKKTKRKARKADINPRDGRAYDGIAVAMKHFSGGTGDWAVMNKGIADMLTNDIAAGGGGCKYTVVEWEHRAEVIQEIELQQSPLFDPSTRLERGHLIDPQLFITGTISISGDGPGAALTLNAQLLDAKTGAVRGRASVTDVGENFFDAEQKLARDISSEICVIQTGAAAPTSGGPPAGSSGYTGTVSGSGTIGPDPRTKVSWSGHVVWKVTDVSGVPVVAGFPAGDYAIYVVKSGDVEIELSGSDDFGCSFTGKKSFTIPPGRLDRLVVQLKTATPAYQIGLGSRDDVTMPVVWSGGPDCEANSPTATLPPFPYATAAKPLISSSRALVGSEQATVPNLLDITTRWSLSPG